MRIPVRWIAPVIVTLLAAFAVPVYAGDNFCITDADCTDPSLPHCNLDTNMCEAEPQGCSSDADCTDPSLPICNLDTNMCEAPPVICTSDLDCTDPAFPHCNIGTGMCEEAPNMCLTDADCTDPSLPHCNPETNMCEAETQGCSSDADCIDPAFPFCNLATMECQADMVSTLSGVVVDRADSSIMIHPVAVSLFDVNTGAWTGVTANNQADGSWEMYDVTPGDYLVFFDANGAASDYFDELYDQAPCDGGACDPVADGTPFNIVQGDNTLDYNLSFSYSLSGTVENNVSQPLQGTQLQIYDLDGFPVGVAVADSLGDWIYPRIRTGIYYVKTIPSSVPGYFPEIWDDIVCYNCDPPTTGDPLVVIDSNLVDIQFILAPLPPPLVKDGFENIDQ